MTQVQAKICGLTRPSDAAFAALHGADWLGVIFAGGPRLLHAAAAREIVVAAGDCPVVGVFAESDAEAMLAMRDATGIRAIQLHGGSDAATVQRLQSEGLAVWSVRRPDSLAALLRLDEPDVCAADGVLVEAHVPGALGGTGRTLDLEIGIAARHRLAGRRMILAGGLTPETVAARLALVGPDVADVSSGVETAPGIKDPMRLLRFLEVVRGCATRP